MPTGPRDHTQFQATNFRRGEHDASRKTIACGTPDDVGVFVVTHSCAFFIAHEAADASRVRRSARPLFRGAERDHDDGVPAPQTTGVMSHVWRPGTPMSGCLTIESVAVAGTSRHPEVRAKARNCAADLRASKDDGDGDLRLHASLLGQFVLRRKCDRRRSRESDQSAQSRIVQGIHVLKTSSDAGMV